jgi:iron-sulfur cluster insertion protein
MMHATEEAQNKAAEIFVKNPGKVFRIAISGGGCSGFKNDFELTEREPDDIIVAECGDSAIVTDVISQMYLEGAVLDFKNDPFMASFVLNNPNVKSSCGCGNSVSFG